MKKLLVSISLVLFILGIGIFFNAVDAATLRATPTTVEQGQNVTVTIDVGSVVDGARF